MGNRYLVNILKFAGLVLLQVLLLDNILLFGYVNPYVYILFLIMLPTTINRSRLLVVAFFRGLCIDIFNNTGGVHAASTLIISFIRPFLLKLSFGLSYDYNTLNLTKTDFKSLLVYISMMVFIHHTFLFILEYYSFTHLKLILKNIALSFLLTEIFIIILIKLFNYK